MIYHRHAMLWICLIVFGTGFLASDASAAAAERQKPNILVIIVDDLGFADVGMHPGGLPVPTPNVDRIAAGGVRFSNGYATAPVCSPSRAGLMTGRYQQRFGHEFNTGGSKEYGADKVGLPTTEGTLAGMVAAMDEGIGRVLEKLENAGLEEETLVFFINDNGGGGGNASVNEPLSGFKGQVWEGGIRVPFAMRWKGRVPAGVVFDHPVISLDIFATAVAAAGAALPRGRQIDGVNLLPYVTGELSS